MPFRSVRLRIDNMTSSTLAVAWALNGEFTGGWSPPQTIAPNEARECRAESDGVGTGTSGWIRFQPGDPTFVSIAWDNPAVGNTFFEFEITDLHGKPDPNTAFTFFPRHFATGPAQPGEERPTVYAVTQGDIDGGGLIVPVPGQQHLRPHAWFDIGLRDVREPVRVGRWLRSLGLDPAQGIRALRLAPFSIRALIGPPPDWNAPILQ